jgi:hypothetical protein
MRSPRDQPGGRHERSGMFRSVFGALFFFAGVYVALHR